MYRRSPAFTRIATHFPYPTLSQSVARSALSYCTDNYKRITADVNAMLTEHVGARCQGVWHDQDVAGRDAIYQRRWGVAPSVTIGLGTPTRLTASYYYLESHELPDSGIPYLYTLGNAPEIGRASCRGRGCQYV